MLTLPLSYHALAPLPLTPGMQVKRFLFVEFIPHQRFNSPRPTDIRSDPTSGHISISTLTTRLMLTPIEISRPMISDSKPDHHNPSRLSHSSRVCGLPSAATEPDPAVAGTSTGYDWPTHLSFSRSPQLRTGGIDSAGWESRWRVREAGFDVYGY